MSKKTGKEKGREKGQERTQPTRGPRGAPSVALPLIDDLQDAERRLKCSSLQSTQGPILIPLFSSRNPITAAATRREIFKSGDRTLKYLKPGDRSSTATSADGH